MYVCKQTISCNEFTKLDLDEIKGSIFFKQPFSKTLLCCSLSYNNLVSCGFYCRLLIAVFLFSSLDSIAAS